MLITLMTAAALQVSPLSSDGALEDIALAREALERVHPGYDRYTSQDQLDAAWIRLQAMASERSWT